MLCYVIIFHDIKKTSQKFIKIQTAVKFQERQSTGWPQEQFKIANLKRNGAKMATILWPQTILQLELICQQKALHLCQLGQEERALAQIYKDIFQVWMKQTYTCKYFISFNSESMLVDFFSCNFYEYALHHGLSTFLIFFSYLMNMWLIGIFVLLIHDLSDLFLILARAQRDYRNYKKRILQVIYIFAIVSWVGCRIVLFSYCCVYSSMSGYVKAFILNYVNDKLTQPMKQVLYLPYFSLVFMLAALQILQLFWTYYIGASFVSVNISEKVAKHTYD